VSRTLDDDAARGEARALQGDQVAFPLRLAFDDVVFGAVREQESGLVGGTVSGLASTHHGMLYGQRRKYDRRLAGLTCMIAKPDTVGPCTSSVQRRHQPVNYRRARW
jgi:hypothetical protein